MNRFLRRLGRELLDATIVLFAIGGWVVVLLHESPVQLFSGVFALTLGTGLAWEVYLRDTNGFGLWEGICTLVTAIFRRSP